jgi:hypothetical protein
LLPQRQLPVAQLSAFVVSHVEHAPPLVPQLVIDGVLQVLPVQQPDAHVIEHPAHAPATQAVPDGQVAHELPPEPHAIG